MRVLIVKSLARGVDSSFIREQMDSCRNLGVDFEVFNITGGGATGYAKAYFRLIQKIVFGRYDLVHAHYGLAGFISVMQPFTPVVVTFHGCDVNDPKTRRISKIAYRFCSEAIVVEDGLVQKLKAKRKITVVPCGVDTEIFHPISKEIARKELGVPAQKRIILFASGFDIPVKNAALAKEAIAPLEDVELWELKNKTRVEVNLLLNACDLLLLTSVREGSPMIIKEALAAECPIVSVNVGDVHLRAGGVNNVHICPHEPQALREAILQLISSGVRSNGRQRIFEHGLDLHSIAKRIYTIYQKCAGLQER